MITRLLTTLILVAFITGTVYSGNPDRTGQAGATELLINPWARSSGWNGVNTARVSGLEAMRLNVGGLAFTKKTELIFSRTNYLQGTGIALNTIGFSQHAGEAGVIGFELMSMDFGEIDITTTLLPEGGIGKFRPQFINLAVGYSQAFSNSIYAGIVVRGIAESISNVSAVGVAFDAGIQYITGATENIRFGIALRNIGTRMRFGGDGLSFRGLSPDGTYLMTLEQRSEKFELPTLLNIGGAYDFQIQTSHRITLAANFRSNSYSQDEYGVGVEYAFKENFMVRTGYNVEDGIIKNIARDKAETGISAGFTIEMPLNKESESTVALDYAFRHTDPFQGIHSLGIRISL